MKLMLHWLHWKGRSPTKKQKTKNTLQGSYKAICVKVEPDPVCIAYTKSNAKDHAILHWLYVIMSFWFSVIYAIIDSNYFYKLKYIYIYLEK